jgi:hypothetical protein
VPAAAAHVGAAVGAHADRVRERVVTLDAVEVDDLGRLGPGLLRRWCRRLGGRLLAAASGQRTSAIPITITRISAVRLPEATEART